MTKKFDNIRFYTPKEIQNAIKNISHDPMLIGLMRFTFPDKEDSFLQEKLAAVKTTEDFQKNIIYTSLLRVLAMSSDGLTTSGFEALDKTKAYLYISNHRDIILDTSLLNVALLEHELVMTASAIGDNLVKKPLLNDISKINRNFLVLRNLPPRELLDASVTLSTYVQHLLHKENRSVWIAQREGRTKDGIDATHSGVLKMLSLAAEKGENLAYFFKNMNILPISMAYEYDPTDILKLPELLANLRNEKYEKSENEDYNTIMRGILGQKKGIHISAGKLLCEEFDEIAEEKNMNKQIKKIVQLIDNQILTNYHLWASNYIAYDMLYNTTKFADKYDALQKAYFTDRMNRKIDVKNEVVRHQFLSMYANPVNSKMNVLQ